MSRNIILRLNPDMKTIGFNGNKLCLKISARQYNGLSIVNGKIIAIKAPDGSGESVEGTMNTPGNAIGPLDSTESTSLSKVGFNSTVTRHQKYAGNDAWIHNNDGPVMTKLNGTQLVANGSIAAYMISHAGG